MILPLSLYIFEVQKESMPIDLNTTLTHPVCCLFLSCVQNFRKPLHSIYKANHFAINGKYAFTRDAQKVGQISTTKIE